MQHEIINELPETKAAHIAQVMEKLGPLFKAYWDEAGQTDYEFNMVGMFNAIHRGGLILVVLKDPDPCGFLLVSINQSLFSKSISATWTHTFLVAEKRKKFHIVDYFITNVLPSIRSKIDIAVLYGLVPPNVERSLLGHGVATDSILMRWDDSQRWHK